MRKREKLRLPARVVCVAVGLVAAIGAAGCDGGEEERYDCYADESVDAGPGFDAAVCYATGVVDDPEDCPAGCIAESTLA